MIRHKTLGRFLCLAIVGLVLTGCDQKPIGGPLELKPGPQTFHQVGVFNAQTATMTATSGEVGMLAYGPYIQLPPGHYEASFLISAGPANAAAGRVDVNSIMAEQPASILGAISVPAGIEHQELVVPFNATAGAKLEFRVYSEGLTTMTLSRIQLKKKT